MAWWNMCQCPGSNDNRIYDITADEYAVARYKASLISSENASKRVGELNPNYGKHFTEEHKRKLAISHIGMVKSEGTRKKISLNHADVSGKNNPRATAVFCIEVGKKFDTILQASEWCGINRNAIVKYLSGKQKYAGKHPVTGEKLHWKYIE